MEDFTGQGVGTEKNRGAVDISGKSEFPVSPEAENSHCLTGDKSVIALTRADHDSVQVCFTACNSCHYWRMPWFVIERLFLKWNPFKRNFSISSLKDEQIEATVHLLRSEDVAIFPTGFEESLMYQLYATAKEMQMCECWSKSGELKELRIPSIVLSTKETKEDVLLLIGEWNTSLFSEDSRGLFGYKIPKHFPSLTIVSGLL